MKIDEWLTFFKQHQEKKLFSLQDLSQLTGEQNSSLSVQLTRLIKTGVLKRAARLWYENPFQPPAPEETAMVLRYPCYLSLEYALSKQGILSQHVYTLTLITTKLPYTYTTHHTIYEYHQIQQSLFWGYQSEGTVLIAEPEKAFLDLLYIRCVRTKGLTLKNVQSLLDDMTVTMFKTKRLHQYANQYGTRMKKILDLLAL